MKTAQRIILYTLSGNDMTTNRKMEINDYTDGVLLQLQGTIPVSNTTIFELVKIIDELLQELNNKA